MILYIDTTVSYEMITQLRPDIPLCKRITRISHLCKCKPRYSKRREKYKIIFKFEEYCGIKLLRNW